MCSLLALSLLLVNKVMNKEASQILYGCDRFDFDTVLALWGFFDGISSCGALVRDVDVNQRERVKPRKGLGCLAYMAKPTRITVDARGVPHDRSSTSVLHTWAMIEPIVCARKGYIFDGAVMSRLGRVCLYEEEQRQRLDAIEFNHLYSDRFEDADGSSHVVPSRRESSKSEECRRKFTAQVRLC